MNEKVRGYEDTPKNVEETAQVSDFALDSLDNLRKRLLDLTARNRLINFRFSKTNQIRIIDELPNQLAETLISEKTLTFRAVPEPTKEELIDAGYIGFDEETNEQVRLRPDPNAKEWAKQIGLDTSYELPALSDSSESKHNDTEVQTLMFPPELESRLRNIRTKATTAIEETGSNFLYIAFGFLEWFENTSSDVSRLAPLYLIPVSLEKGTLDPKTRRYLYTLSYTGEDILPNLSLQEKLRVDFGIGLPELDETALPEEYFEKLSSIIQSVHPNWNIKRQCVLSLLEFGNLLMYLDLDPENWPEGDRNITSHDIVSRFFSTNADSDEEGGAGSFSGEYTIDQVESIHDQFPLIDDADSSQHSAVIDAINGKNLVIEGPPGTGKSQTITNIIAAALSHGKSVLFVAEKLAALEVVKRRLDNANLGDFCLELHSHKTQKRKILDDINRRLVNQARYRSPKNIETEIARYEDLKDKLNSYVELINSNWKSTGRTIHEILNSAVRYREEGNLDSLKIHPTDLSGESCTTAFQREIIDNIRLYCDVFQKVCAQLGRQSDITSHPWHGVENTELQVFDTPSVVERLKVWTESLEQLHHYIENANAQFSFSSPLARLDEIDQFVESVEAIPELQGNEYFPALAKLHTDQINTLDAYTALTRSIQDSFGSLSQELQPEYLDDLSTLRELQSSIDSLQDIGVADHIGFEDLSKTIQRIERVLPRIEVLKKLISELSNHLDPEFEKHISDSVNGLNEFKIFIDKVCLISPSLLKHRDQCFEDDDLDSALSELSADISSLTPQVEALTNHFNLSTLPSSSELDELDSVLQTGGIFKWFKASWRQARQNLLSLKSSPTSGFDELNSHLKSLRNYAKEFETFSGKRKYARLLGNKFDGLHTPIEEYIAVRNWYSNVRNEYGVGFGSRTALGSLLIDMPTQITKGIQNLHSQGVLDEIDAALGEVRKIQLVIPASLTFSSDDNQLCGAVTNSLNELQEEVNAKLKSCQSAVTKSNTSVHEFLALLRELQNLQEMVQQWKKYAVLEDIFDSTLHCEIGFRSDVSEPLSTLINTSNLAKYVNSDSIAVQLREVLCLKGSPECVAALKNLAADLDDLLEREEGTGTEYERSTKLNITAWEGAEKDNISSLIERNTRAINQPNWLSIWVDFVRFRQKIEAQGFSSLISAVEQGNIDIEETESALHLGIYDVLSREILRENPDLSQFSGQLQSAIQAQFCEYDERLKSLQRERIAYLASRNKAPTGNSGGKVSNYSEMSLIKHEAGKKTRHIPIRQMIRRAGNALTSIKPCFMMGPKSVAQYLPPGQLQFDIVIIDEASQVKPQDALGAIARGRQFIVVGDPKQLPPTSFFDKLADDDDDEEVTGIQQSESVLSAAAPLFPMRRLRWHYRSQHEDLIAFSNHSFYDSNLVVFPSPHSESPDYGVKLHRVHRGRFINQRNVEEARVIAESVAEHLLTRPDESLGVVAMSAQQREQIDRAIEELVKDDPRLQQALETNQNTTESLFVKNLENVQGDERDVIYISCTYGPHDSEGKQVFQRFGPINSDSGWRRLNVLFTRSKKRMHIFSSLDSDDIKLSESSKRGVRAFKEFLAFAKSGHIHQPQLTGKAPDSDFEIAVANALINHGYECVPQVGVAGFYIDLAVKDPGKPGRFLMGIECDGATYHSAKSARDRDRLRQSVLEGLGWNISRIWSTDWFKNPDAQLRPIIDELDTLRTVIEPSTSHDVSTEIEQLIEEQEAEEQHTDIGLGKGETLKEKMVNFDSNVIRKEFPDVPRENRLLRPAMIEALLHERPMDLLEFQSTVAAYLRDETDGREGRFLKEVLRIIAEHEEEEV